MADICEEPTILAPYNVGTTWCGLTDVTISPVIESDLATVVVTFSKGGTVIQTLTSPTGITITDATNWLFDIDAQVLTVTKGDYSIVIKTTDATGYIRKFPVINLTAI